MRDPKTMNLLYRRAIVAKSELGCATARMISLLFSFPNFTFSFNEDIAFQWLGNITKRIKKILSESSQGCDLFLMSNGPSIEVSDRYNLYLYKEDKEEKFYYKIKGQDEKQYLGRPS